MSSVAVGPAAPSAAAKGILPHLPDDVTLTHILPFLKGADLKNAAPVSRAFGALAGDDKVWQTATEKRFGADVASVTKANHRTWKETYLSLETAAARSVRTTLGPNSSTAHRAHNAAAGVFGSSAQSAATILAPVETGYWRGRQITVLKKIDLSTDLD